MKRFKLAGGLLLATGAMALFGAACGGDEEPTATATATATRTATATATSAPAGSPTVATSPTTTGTTTTTPGAGDPAAGATVFSNKGCAGCHSVSSSAQTPSPVGPGLMGIGTRAGTRKAGMTADAYLRESVLTPNAFVVPNFTANIMPSLFSGPTDAGFNDLIAYLLSLK